MSDITISYKGSNIATMDASGTKTLLTEGKYCEDDISVVYVKPASPSGTKSITANGTGIDVASYAYADVAVPNTYSAGDEGKVVSNGALVGQTAHADVTPTISDQTIDTTLNNSIKVKGDADLVAANIKKDVEIFGVTGSYEGGGGSYGNLVKYENITFTSTATSSNKVNVSLLALTYCNILVIIDQFPSVPDSTEYIALSWNAGYIAGTQSGGTHAAILRPNGTIGTDNTMGTYTPSTGNLAIGGSYGHFMAGTTYHIYQFEIEV